MRDTIWQRLFQGVQRIRQQPGWAPFQGAGWADRIMGIPITDRFHAKQGRTIARWTLQGPSGRRLVVFLKRHYRLEWWRGLLALLWPNTPWSPALQEWEHLEWARSAGLPVPTALAGGEYIGPWFKFQSFIAIEELIGMLPLHEAVPAAAARLPGDAFTIWKRGLAREMADIVLDLHRRRRFHKDLYLCHFYIAEQDTTCLPDWRGRVRLIDFHRLGHHRWLSPWWRAKDLGQLLYSSNVPGVGPRDRLHFWRLYRKAAGLRWSAPLLARWIRLKAWNYQRRSQRKRA
jgi:heptose I phosphotransferase